MELKFEVSGRINKSVEDVFEAVVNPEKLSGYFTTGGASGCIETGATVNWNFADHPGAFPVKVIEVVANRRIVLEWEADDSGEDSAYNTTVTMRFEALEGGRTLISIAEEGWSKTETGLKGSYGNCMGWSQMLCALKAYVEHGINLREGMYK